MKAGKANTPVILGQPWQRTYNGVPNWRKEGINFEYDSARLFTPFLKDEDFATDGESDDEEGSSDPNETKKPVPVREEEGHSQGSEEKKQEEVKVTIKAPTSKRTSNHQQLKTEARVVKPKKETLSTVWVPKKLVQAQINSPRIWIPRQQAVKQSSSLNKNRRKSKRKESKEPAIKSSTKAPWRTDSRQIWVKKTLLKAQQGSHYKWIPKSLLRTINTKQQTRQRKQPSNIQTDQPKGHKRWIPKKVLRAQGYYEGATRIWTSRQYDRNIKKQQEQMHLRVTSKRSKLQETKWVQNTQTVLRKEPPTEMRKTHRRATAQEKGKWVPKSEQSTLQEFTQIPSTSQQKEDHGTHKENLKKQEPNKPRSLDAAQHLAFILKAFNSKQIQEHLRRFLAHTAGTQASPANALGPYPLQDHLLAQH